jgi:hypothetical protein
MKRTIGTTDQPLDVPYDGTGEGTKGHFWHAAVMACYCFWHKRKRLVIELHRD